MKQLAVPFEELVLEAMHKSFAQGLTSGDVDLLKLRESVGRGSWSDVFPIVSKESAERIQYIRGYENLHHVDLLQYVPQNL
jgi:hypothetical protein